MPYQYLWTVTCSDSNVFVAENLAIKEYLYQTQLSESDAKLPAWHWQSLVINPYITLSQTRSLQLEMRDAFLKLCQSVLSLAYGLVVTIMNFGSIVLYSRWFKSATSQLK